MGNVEGQEVDLESLTPEQRQHYHQQRELHQQQQQLHRDQEQLKQRLHQQQQQKQQLQPPPPQQQQLKQQKQQLERQQQPNAPQQQTQQQKQRQQQQTNHQQQLRTNSSPEQDVNGEQMRGPEPQPQKLERGQQQNAQMGKQLLTPQQKLETQTQDAAARVNPAAVNDQLAIQDTHAEQRNMQEQRTSQSCAKAEQSQTHHRTQFSFMAGSQIPKSSEQFTQSKMKGVQQENQSRVDRGVSGDSRHTIRDADPSTNPKRVSGKSEPKPHADNKEHGVQGTRTDPSYSQENQRPSDRPSRHERGRAQERGRPARRDEGQKINRPEQSNVSPRRIERTEKDSTSENGNTDLRGGRSQTTHSQEKAADAIASTTLEHPQRLPLEKSPKRNVPLKSETGYLSTSPNPSPAISPQRSPLPSPMMPPGDPIGDPSKDLGADLSQLTEEERAHILAVLDRARQLQEKDETRVRDMENNLEKIEREISDRGYQSDSQINETGTCPICCKSYRGVQADLLNNKDCDDCGKTVCAECGSTMKSAEDKPRSRPLLVRTSSYSAVDDMRKNMDDTGGDEQSATPEPPAEESERSTPLPEGEYQSFDSDEIHEEEMLLLTKRSRDRSPEYERRASAGQEEVLRHLRREERGFLVSDNTIEMDHIDDIDHVEDLSEGPDEEEMLRQLIEMADSSEDEFASFPDHVSSSSDYFIGGNVDRYDGHQEILETTQQIAKFTESRNLSDYDLHKASAQEDPEPVPSDVDTTVISEVEQSNQQQTDRSESLAECRTWPRDDYKPPKPMRGIVVRKASSLESSPAHDFIGKSSTDRELDYQGGQEPQLKYSVDVTSHSDSELEQKKDKSSRKKKKKACDTGGLGDPDQDTVGTDKFLSVEDLREVGIEDEVSEDTNFLTVPDGSECVEPSLYETKGNRPPAAGQSSGSSRRKKGQKYQESPLSPIRDDEIEAKQETKMDIIDDDADEELDFDKFVYPPNDAYWEGSGKESELNEDEEEDELGYDDDELDDGSSSYLTSPGGLETVMEEQEDPMNYELWTDKRSYAYSKSQKKRIVELNKDLMPEEIEDSSPEDSKSVLQLQEAPSGKRPSNKSGETGTSDGLHERLVNRRESPDMTSPERRIVRSHHRRSSPEMRHDDRKEMHSKEHSPFSRVGDSTSPTASPVSSRSRFSPPITPKLCSTGKSFPEATFPKDLTPTDTTHHEVVDENRNAIVDRQETTPTNEIVGFAARGRHSPVAHNEKHRHPRKRHAVSTQTEKRKSQREISTQTRSEYEMKRSTSGEKVTRSTGVQAGDDTDMFLPKKIFVDVGVETESDVSTTSSPVSLASSRSVGIDSRDPNYSSGMSSPVSDVGSERMYTETAVQTLSDSFVQTDPVNIEGSDLVPPSSYYAMDRSTHTSPSLSYHATQDPKVAGALMAVLGDFPPMSPRSYGIHGSSGSDGKSDIKTAFQFRGNGFDQASRARNSSFGVQTPNLNLQQPSKSHQIGSSGLSRPTAVSPGSDIVRKKPSGGRSYQSDGVIDQHETRISHSDTESVDSDLGTPKVRRRLPKEPPGSSPSASPALGKPAGEVPADYQAGIELNKVKGLLSRKAIQLEMERRKHELDEMTSKIFGPSSVSKSSPNVSQQQTQRGHSDGTHSDSDVLPRRKTNEKGGHDRTNEQPHTQIQSNTKVKAKPEDEAASVPMALDKDKYVQFSKSEEDIIREIERQVTQATGKAYSALEEDTNGPSKTTKTKRATADVAGYGNERSFRQYEGGNPRGMTQSRSYDRFDPEVESQRFWDIDTSPVHIPNEPAFPTKDPVREARYMSSKSFNEPLQPPRDHGSSDGRRREVEGAEWKKDPTGRIIPQLIKDNQNEVDRLSREGEDIERRIKELTMLEAKLETDYQQYRTHVATDNQRRDSHPESLVEYLMKSHRDPSLRFEKSTDGQYEYTTAHWSNSDDSLSGSGSRLASSSSESRLLPARPSGDGSDEREVEGAGLILPLGEGSDFDGDVSVPPPVPLRTDLPAASAPSSAPPIPKRDLPPVTAHSESRHKQPRQLPVPKGDPQQVSRSEGHRSSSNPGTSSQQPPVPRRNRGERTSNIFHLKRSSDGPSPGSGSGGDLGLRVVGGKRMPGSNQLVAYITDVVEGAAAQKAGLREGDQVLEWCGTPLTGKTFEEVQLIMRTARKMADVTVKRGPNLLDSPRYRATRPPGRDSQRSHYHSSNASAKSSSGHGHRREQPNSGQRPDHYPPKQVVRPTSDGKSYRITGELQVRLAYDAGRGELRVDVLRGRGLVGKSNDGLADPFVVVRLLPMKSSSDEKRTACVPRTLTPEWNQTLLFRDLRASELLTNHNLELNIWSSSRNEGNFMGKVMFNLSDTKHLDNRVHWYRLTNGGSTQGKSNKNIGFV